MSLFSKASGDTRAEVFALGERANILLHLDAAALIPHVVEAEGKKFPPEVLLFAVFLLSFMLFAPSSSCSELDDCNIWLGRRLGTRISRVAVVPQAGKQAIVRVKGSQAIPTLRCHMAPPGAVPEREQAADGHGHQRVPVLRGLLW